MPLSSALFAVVQTPVSPRHGVWPEPLLLMLWSLLGAAGVLGLIALVSPRWFAAIARVGNHWVDTSKWLARFDTRVDVDARILPYSRHLGAVVIASVTLLAFVLIKR
jgi:hypothetical protein